MKWIGLSKMTFHPSSPHYLRKLCASGNIKEHIIPFVPRSGHISFHLCPHHDHPLLPYHRRGFAARQEGGEDAWMLFRRNHLEIREEGICGLSGWEGGGAVFGDWEACGGSCGIRLSAAGEREPFRQRERLKAVMEQARHRAPGDRGEKT